MSPTARSLAKLRKDGYLATIVEKFVRFPPPGHRVDMWGFGDLVGIKGDESIIVQSTTGDNVSKRVAKIKGIKEAGLWLASPHRRIVVHGWSKQGPRGKAKRWQCREVEITKPFP